MGGTSSKHNLNIVKTLHRGDILRVGKPDGNKYYIYGGDWNKLYPLDENSRDCFTVKENTLEMDESSAIPFENAFGDSYCYKSSEIEWIQETKGTSLPAQEYNKEVLKTLLPGDIVKMGLHNLLYIGNGRVIHLIGRKWSLSCSTSNRLPKRHQKKLDACPGANGLVAKDKFLTLGKSKKAYKANRSDLHSLPYKMVITRALSQLGPAEFRLCSKNCKDFVLYMKYGFQISSKILSFAFGKDPGILCLNQENLEMACMAEDIPSLDDGLSDESDGSDDLEIIDWISELEDSDVSSLDDGHNYVNGLGEVRLVVDHGNE